MKTFFKKQQGFTLIELMLVIGIIGVIASIAMPAYKDYMAKTKWGKAIYGIRALKLAVENCLVDKAGSFSNCDTLEEVKVGAYGVTTYATGGANSDFSQITLKATTAEIEIKGNAPLGFCMLRIKPVLPPGTGMISWGYTMYSTSDLMDIERCRSLVRGAVAGS